MTKNKPLNFIVPLVIYPFDVMFSFGETDEQVVSRLKKYGIDTSDNKSWTFEETTKGRCIVFPGNQTLIRLMSRPANNLEYGFLQHEIFHATHFIMRKMGFKLKVSSCEAYSYLIQYLTQQIYNKLSDGRKRNNRKP